MRILSIDPGTHCGYAVWQDGSFIASGVWDLSSRRHEGGGMRLLRFERHFTDAVVGVNLIAYEEVRRHAGTDAAHIYGALTGIIQKQGELCGVPYYGIPVGTIKKFATGKGNADKAKMIAAGEELWGEVLPEDEVDARFVALVAAKEYGGKK